MQTNSKYRTMCWLHRRKKIRGRILQIIAFLLFSLLLTVVAGAQPVSQAKTLSFPQVMELVRKFHPVGRIATIGIEKAAADIRIARGGFDPLFYNSAAAKTFNGTSYYQYNRPELSIPTWFGIEVNTGLEYLSGSRTDPQETTGKTSYFGISVPLAKNLLLDKRRAALQSAKIFRLAAETERRTLLNELLKDVASAFWNWVQFYQEFRILEEAVQVNRQRLVFTRNGFLLGDRPAIDTTEVLAQLQNFELEREQALLSFRNAGLALSVFLWTSGEDPYDLPEEVVPAETITGLSLTGISVPALDSLMAFVNRSHPELESYQYKLDALKIEKKLKLQELLPAVNLRYNQLGKGYAVLKTATGPLFENNYRYGLSVGFPLRFSAGRGEYRKAGLKLRETGIARDYKQREIETKLKTCYNEWQGLREQVRIQENAFTNYSVLLQGEETRFRNGESSLFLVNARENKKLEVLRKLTELKIKLIKSAYNVQWAAGLLGG